jgi:hypothetical protein
MENSIDDAINRVNDLYLSLAMQELTLLRSPATNLYDYDDEPLNVRKDALDPQVHLHIPFPPLPPLPKTEDRSTFLKSFNDGTHDLDDYLTYGSLGIAISGVPATLCSPRYQ